MFRPVPETRAYRQPVWRIRSRDQPRDDRNHIQVVKADAAVVYLVITLIGRQRRRLQVLEGQGRLICLGRGTGYLLPLRIGRSRSLIDRHDRCRRGCKISGGSLALGNGTGDRRRLRIGF